MSAKKSTCVKPQFPTEIPEVSHYVRVVPNPTTKNKQAELEYVACSLLYFGDPELMPTKTAGNYVPNSMLMDLLRALENFFIPDDTEPNLSKRIDLATAFMNSWPVWCPMQELVDSREYGSVCGVPYLSWDADEKARILNQFERICDAAKIRPYTRVPVEDLLCLMAHANTLRSMNVLFTAVSDIEVFRERKVRKSTQEALMSCCGWTVP